MTYFDMIRLYSHQNKWFTALRHLSSLWAARETTSWYLLILAVYSQIIQWYESDNDLESINLFMNQDHSDHVLDSCKIFYILGSLIISLKTLCYNIIYTGKFIFNFSELIILGFVGEQASKALFSSSDIMHTVGIGLLFLFCLGLKTFVFFSLCKCFSKSLWNKRISKEKKSTWMSLDSVLIHS